MKTLITICALVAASFGAAAQTAAPSTKPSPGPDRALIEHGRYLVKITGCNDCHTAGYAPAAGKIAEKDWLLGSGLGWQGPWGTTYATNLRLHFAGLSEAQWLAQAKAMQSRPPMPSFVFRDMKDADLKAIYAYIRAAGPAGQPAPAYVPPGQAARGPVVKFPQ